MRTALTTRQAIELIARQLTDELAIGTTGLTCRDMQAAADRPHNFYMIGSMGLAASIGLGVALHQPDRCVVVFDGDGSLLMGLGNLAMIGALKPLHFIHLVFDNEVFASTGNQPTYSSQVDLKAVAQAAGYAHVRRADTPEDLLFEWNQLRFMLGPHLLLVKCHPDEGPARERIRLSPEEITDRFMRSTGSLQKKEVTLCQKVSM